MTMFCNMIKLTDISTNRIYICFETKVCFQKIYANLKLVKYTITEFNIDYREFETLRWMHRIFGESEQPWSAMMGKRKRLLI